MERVALVSAVFFSLLFAVNGSMAIPAVFAQKNRSPKEGVLWGGLVGGLGSLLPALVILQIFPTKVGLGVLVSFIGGIGALTALQKLLPDHALEHETGAPRLSGSEQLKYNIVARHIRGTIMRTLYRAAIAVALVSLATLIWTIINRTVGLTAVQYVVQPPALTINGVPTGRELEDLSDEELGAVLAEHARVARLRVFILRDVKKADQEKWAVLSPQPIENVLKGQKYADALAETPLNKLNGPEAASILVYNLHRTILKRLVFTEVIQPEVMQSWTLWDSLSQRNSIKTLSAEKYPEAELTWRSWVSWEFISSPLDPRKPDTTGLRPALYGSLMIIAITIVVAFPVGVGAAIYLEEYAGDTWFNRIIQTNISNLAGVPSIIYGMLGLAIFVRSLETLTSGQALGTDTANGRTILSAGFTLALLILPLIIINAQEAIKAVPSSLRQASYGLGATQWQTIWHHVLPYAMPGILTGTILAISRALGETAPLILVGAATYITKDPTGPFSNFTALPMVIYRWTTLPQAEFRNAAAAAIVVLLALLLTLNSVAVILRNRFSRRLS